MEIEGELWMAPNDVLVLVKDDGEVVHISETISRQGLWGKRVKITFTDKGVKNER